ncbi:DUF5004 domain-containing protein [Paenimyroides tangerinum]|uniref:DUF5004 domain-containing protein n=1 Tax=Paenimyroides tangerinum TaxID=2488728 RepID=A0A3P3W8L5_9FLAO|nr:DUF5004 domain-containing protein [Paenimyroides tangerinum]RRJ91501.1 DUF5004 domain-containing protein [Paenimyroides tangerinum]
MKNYIIILFLFIGFSMNAQVEKIVGNWSVKEVVSPKGNPVFEELIQSLDSSTFEFKSDKTLKLKTNQSAGSLDYMVQMIEQSKWNFENDIITLTDKSGSMIFMKIYVSTKDDKTLFSFQETDLILEVSKI